MNLITFFIKNLNSLPRIFPLGKIKLLEGKLCLLKLKSSTLSMLPGRLFLRHLPKLNICEIGGDQKGGILIFLRSSSARAVSSTIARNPLTAISCGSNSFMLGKAIVETDHNTDRSDFPMAVLDSFSQYIRAVRLKRDGIPFDEFPFTLPFVRNLHELELHSNITYIVGENGMGKSTLLEGIAIAYGFNPEGGTLNFNFSSFDSHSELDAYIRLVRSGKGPFFLPGGDVLQCGVEYRGA